MEQEPDAGQTDDQTDEVTDSESLSLSALGIEATIFFAVAACAVAFAIGLWFSVAPGIGPHGESSFTGKFLLYGGIPFFTTFAVISAVLGSLALRHHKREIEEIRGKAARPQEFVVKKDGMDADLTVPPE